MLWGLFHGLLLIATRAGRTSRLPAGGTSRWLTVAQIATMFVLTNIGWLLFRETSLAAIVHDLTLSPFKGTSLDRQAAEYLFILAFLYSVPLWIQSLWVELHRGETGEARLPTAQRTAWARLTLQGAACGLAFAAILVLRSRTSLDFIYFHF
jgi:hypothetical protein